jgi:hypothetical protein
MHSIRPPIYERPDYRRHARVVCHIRSSDLSVTLELVADMPATRRKQCWWCGAEPTSENPMTKEHIIGKWLAGPMHGSGILSHAFREYGAEQDTRSWQGVEPSFTARSACRVCNNGWMSSLESAAKRRLPPFMRGKRGLRINYTNAPVLARWAAKTGLMFQAPELAENRVVPADHFQLLRQAEVLPPEMRVWIGAVEARGVWSHSFGGTFNLPARSSRFYTVLLAVDQAAFMVMGSEDVPALESIRLGPLSSGWTELWPLPAPASWPPPYVWPAAQFPGMPQIMEALIGNQAALRLPA